MHLLYDDYNQIYVWVDDENTGTSNNPIQLSPHFDYEEDAINWYGKISKTIFEEFGIMK